MTNMFNIPQRDVDRLKRLVARSKKTDLIYTPGADAQLREVFSDEGERQHLFKVFSGSLFGDTKIPEA